MFKELKLIIEVDGYFFEDTLQKDKRDEAVLTNIKGVRQLIEDVIDEIEESD